MQIHSLVLCALLASAPVAQSTPLFRLAGRMHLSRVPAHASGVLVGDLTGDGRVDLLVGSQSGAMIHRGNGAARFVLMPELTAGQAFGAHALGDLDGDGDLDVVADHVRILANDGTGHLAEITGAIQPPWPSDHRASALGDLDGDGDLDLALVGGYTVTNSGLWIAINAGNGRFAGRSLDPTGYHDVRTGDADADGDCDIFAFGNTCRLFVNQGNGVFVGGPSIPIGSGTVFRATLFDLDGDSDLDVIGGQGIHVMRNDRTVFTEVTPPALGAIAGVSDYVVLDADGDGDDDVFVTAYGPNRLLLNQAGTLVLAPFPEDSDSENGVAVADVEADGDDDILISGRVSELYLNDGRGAFERATQTPLDVDLAPLSDAYALGDLDGDGILDLVLANGAGSSPPPPGHAVFLAGDGFAGFVDASATAWPSLGASAADVAIGDVDRDGDLDVVFGNHGGITWPGIEMPVANELWRNDGTGRFVPSAGAMAVPAWATSRVQLADLDGDQDLDLHEEGSGSSRIVWNDGGGRFSGGVTFPFRLGEIVDVDGDGDADFVSTRSALRIEVRVNDGAGTFTTRFTSTQVFRGAAIGDFDGDGDPDIVGITSAGALLLVNDGTGSFVSSTSSGISAWSGAIQSGDFDGDGDPDVLVARNELWRNDGTARFTRFTAPTDDLGTIELPVSLADLDRDGDVDLVGARQVFVGLRRQATVLRLPTIGSGFEVQFTDTANLHATRTVLPMIAAGGASIPVPPFGILGIDPAVTVFLPPVTIAPGSLHGWIWPRIPRQSALVGGVLFVQAVFLSGPTPADWHLGNTVRERITAF